MKQFLKQLFCWHVWDKYRGYGHPIKGSRCIKCGKACK